jgi:hypothetical protein
MLCYPCETPLLSASNVSAVEGIDIERGGGPVHAPCPKQRAAKSGGADRTTEINLMWNQFTKNPVKSSWNTGHTVI